MIIKNITLKNFYRYGPNEQKLDLTGTGITGIVGPNGFGKRAHRDLYGKCAADLLR